MGSISSRSVSEALDDITWNVRPQNQEKDPRENLATVSMDSGCHLDDPRSPSTEITRTPIRVGSQKLKFFRGKTEDLLTLFDPRSPGVPRTPIYAEGDEDEDVRVTRSSPLLSDTLPVFTLPTDSSTPMKPSGDKEEPAVLDRSLSDPNLSFDGHDEKLLIKSAESPVVQSRAVTKLRRSMKRARNLVRQKYQTDAAETRSPRSPRGGLRQVDVNSPRVFIQRRASLKIDGLKRSKSSPYKIQSLDKENAPYS